MRMCGFANFGSLGIMIGGLATMAPERRDDVVSLGFKSIVSGTLTTCLIGAIVGDVMRCEEKIDVSKSSLAPR